ncbi:MAG: ABC transporter substrate-binding protein [Bacillota bacterium]
MSKTLVVKLSMFLMAGILATTAVYGAQTNPIKIGAFLSITGPNAPLGTPEKETLLMVEEQINKNGGVNGRPVQVIIEDDGSEPTNAVKAAKKLLEQDKVCVLIGSSGTGTTMAVVGLAADAKVPLVSCAAGIPITVDSTDPKAPATRKYIFRTPQTDVTVMNKILDYLKRSKINKVALIYDSNAFGASGKEQLDKLAPEYKIDVVAEESFNTKDTDMTVQLSKIKNTKAQVIICWGTNPAPALITKAVKQMGIKIPLIQSHGVANTAYLELSGPAANGVRLPAGKLLVAESLPDKDKQKPVLLAYAKDFMAKYGRSADTFGGHAWDAFYIVVNALKKSGEDPEKLRDEIEKTKNFVGISGTFTFTPKDHDGLSLDAVVMVEIKNGKWTLLKQ